MKGHLKPLLNKINLDKNLIDLRNSDNKIVSNILKIWKIQIFLIRLTRKIMPLKKTVKKEFNILVN